MTLLEKLNQCNDVPIVSVTDNSFQSYGRILSGYDWTELMNYMDLETQIPLEGNQYVASVPDMEKLSVKNLIEGTLYGGMTIQIGYCNGRNTTYNGFEYHKGSEINIAVTDFMLVLGHSYDIVDNHYCNEDARVFFVPKGTAIEMYQTTLHLSPLRVNDEGYKDIVILPRGTNTPLSEEEKSIKSSDPEAVLLLQRNKWVIAHPLREPLIRQGAFAGIIGENKELYYK